MTDWPRIRTDVDDDRPAREDEVEYCQHCDGAVLEGDLRKHAGELRCHECCFLCPLCDDVDVYDKGVFCETCAPERTPCTL